MAQTSQSVTTETASSTLVAAMFFGIVPRFKFGRRKDDARQSRDD